MAITAKHFGLVGRNISYSFSQSYFAEKFRQLDLPYTYDNYDISDISEFRDIAQKNLSGLNVTIPYKESVIPFLDGLSETAARIGAVNTIAFDSDGKLIGHNTDFYGFKKSMETLLKPQHQKALILGTGGASKAVAYALELLKIDFAFVSRDKSSGNFSYADLDANVFQEFQIVVNTTPLGTFPQTEQFPELPYRFFTPDHLAYDLIYNPSQTLFLQKASEYGAAIQNGFDMLVFQAEKAWEIWNA